MKAQILAFERIEGRRCVEARRMYNAHVEGLMGGEQLGEGLEKCVYDSNEGLTCQSHSLPDLSPDEVNVVLSKEAFREECALKSALTKKLGDQKMDRIFITLQSKLACSHTKLPTDCTSEARKSSHVVVARSQRGSTSKKFATKQDFGRAILNLIYGLWEMHRHGFVHGDVKIAPQENNAVLVNGVYKLIDLGMVMSLDQVRKGILDSQSEEAKELWRMRKYKWWSVGHLFALLYPENFRESCARHRVSMERCVQLFFENIDLVGLVRSLKILAHLNGHLGLKPLVEQMYAVPSDFQDVKELDARKLVWASAHAMSKSLEVGDRRNVRETFITLPEMYRRVRQFCGLEEMASNIEEY